MAHEACNRWRCLGARMTRNGSQFKSCFRFGIFAIHFPLVVEIRMWAENFLPEWTLRQNDTLSSSLSHSDRAFVRCFALLLQIQVKLSCFFLFALEQLPFSLCFPLVSLSLLSSSLSKSLLMVIQKQFTNFVVLSPFFAYSLSLSRENWTIMLSLFCTLVWLWRSVYFQLAFFNVQPFISLRNFGLARALLLFSIQNCRRTKWSRRFSLVFNEFTI